VQVTFSAVGVLSRKLMNPKKTQIEIWPNFTFLWYHAWKLVPRLKMKRHEKFQFGAFHSEIIPNEKPQFSKIQINQSNYFMKMPVIKFNFK
jgi:hypothetical protein